MWGWEEEIFNRACNLAQEVAEALLENIDVELMKVKDQSLGGRRPERAPNNHGFR